MPRAWHDASFEVQLGSIRYDLGADQFESVPGYTFEHSEHKSIAIRLALGYAFNEYLSAQICYLRPGYWVQYAYTGPDAQLKHNSVRTNLLGLTLKPRVPLTDNLSVYGEVGLGVVTRSGFETPEGTPLVANAQYAAVLLGGGVHYRLSDHWGWTVSALYSPKGNSVAQPATSVVSTGLSYNLLPDPAAQNEGGGEPGYIHPKQWIQIGFTSNVLGYGPNDALADAGVFWAGNAAVRQGLTLNYQRNLFHGKRFFAFDWGASCSYWQSDREQQEFFSLSVFPVFRFNVLHTRPFDAYVSYSVAGPTYLSRVAIDGVDTGEHFTFQDTIGVGVFLGAGRAMNAEVRIGHYSNGNLFPENGAVKVPLSLNVGFAF